MADLFDQWTIFQDVIKEIADIKGWNVEYASNYWINELNASQRWSILTQYGFSPVRATNGNIVGWTRAAEGVAETAGTVTSGAAPQVMEVVEVAEAGGTKVALQNVAQTTTASGKVIQGGGAMTALKVANAALITAAIGGAVARDYKEHNEWWNDLSDAVFQKDEFAGINLGGVMPPVETDWNAVDAGIDVMRVIGRRVEDGLGLSQHYSYMSASDIACLMQQLAVEGAFVPEGIDFPQDVANPHIELSGNQADIYGFCGDINARFNAEYGAWTEAVISNAELVQGVMGAKNRAPLDADCVSIYITGAEHNGQSVTISVFKGTENGSVSVGSDPYSTAYVCQGISSSYGGCIITKRPAGTASYDYYSGTYTPSTSIPYGYYSGDTSSVNKGVVSSNINATYNEGGIPEQDIYPDPDATPFVLGSAATIAEVIQALQDQYPDWWGEGFDLGTYDPNTGIFGSDRWLPVSIPWTDPNNAPYNIPEGYDQPYAQTGRPWPDPDTTPTGYGTPYPYGWDVPYTAPTIPYYFPNNPTPVPTDTPSSPSTPPAVTGSSNALWAVYNPTFSEVSAVGSYLWSSSIIDIVQKFFANPMDGIISLHMIYTTPTTGATQNIKLGYLDSGVSAKIVTNQYKIIDCGEILVPEYYQDVRDYSPYTKCDIFLPFIGIRSLAPEDVINCRLKVKYTVDVLTGAILAELFITKRGATQCLYTFAGNGSVQIPLTGGDRTRLLSGIVSGVTAAVGGAAVGGIAGMAAGAVHGVQGLHNTSSVERTGNFSANAGAMGIKKPYLIINRKDAYDAIGYNSIIGYPANIACRLADCSGYTKVNSVHVENIPGATENEKERILTVLRSGIIIR